MIDQDSEFTPEEEEILVKFLDQVDQAMITAMNAGLCIGSIAGALQARITQIYTFGHDPDFQGLEDLLTSVLEQIQQRPDWPID
jgi:hypothetical protein